MPSPFSSPKALWTKNGSCIVYPCHAIIASIDVSSGQQQFFMGHTDKVMFSNSVQTEHRQSCYKSALNLGYKDGSVFPQDAVTCTHFSIQNNFIQ